MTAYITIDRFKLLSTIPGGFVDAVELVTPGFTAAQLEYWSRWIDAQLAKRYRTPFSAPIPIAIEGWLTRIVTPRIWSKRGVDPTDEQWLEVKADDEAARTEVKEASDGQLGLYDLPLNDGADSASGIARGMPLVYSEASPYVGFDQQYRRGHSEDGSGSGTS